MLVIGRFLGIVIAMYRDDHVPARFHAKYGILRTGLPASAGPGTPHRPSSRSTVKRQVSPALE